MTLIERDLELDAVDVRLASLTGGAGGVLVIEGVPGIGKTALLSAARTRAIARGFRVLTAVGGELDQELPFAIVRQLFEPALRAAPAQTRAELMAGAARLAAPVLALDDPGPHHGTSGLGNVVHGLYWLCSNLAEAGPLLLSIDDIHWADDSSLRFVSHLARRVTDLPVLLLVAGRPGAMVDNLVTRALGGLRPEILRLRPLTIAGVGHLVRRDLASDAAEAFCEACAKASGGNPFLLAEALATLREDGVRPVAAEACRVERLHPEGIARSVLTRIGRLGPEAIRLAHALAVLGPAVELHQVARLAELPIDRAVTLADALASEAIVGHGRPLDFAHPLIRTAVYAECSAVRRAAGHKRAAQVLADDGHTASQLAPHLLAALPGADPWVVDTLRAASSAALARGAPEPAATYLTRALAEPPAPADAAALHAELGRVLAMANRPDEASAAYHRALSLTDAPPERASVALELGFAMARSGRGSQAIEAIELAHQSIDQAVVDLPLPLLASFAFADLVTVRPPATVLGLLEQVLPRLSAHRDTDRGILSTAAFLASATGDRPAGEVVDLARSAATGPLPAQHHWILVNMASAALAMADRLPEALDLLDRGIQATRQLGATADHQYLRVLRSHTALYAGRLAEAEGDARAAMQAESGDGAHHPLAAAMLVDALAARGKLTEAQHTLTGSGLDGDQQTDTLLSHVVLLARGRLRSRQNRTRQALADLRACGATLVAGGYLNPAFAPWRGEAALAHYTLGETTQATDLATENLRLARSFGAPDSISSALRTCGVITGGPTGLELLNEAVSILNGTTAELERASALVEFGAALRRAGYRKQSQEPLREGLDAATGCHADALVARAAEELRAVGLRPRRRSITGRDALTTSELRVAKLAAGGATNRQIAQGLFISRRTVEIHLTSTYRKLQINGRSELPHALHQHTTVDDRPGAPP